MIPGWVLFLGRLPTTGTQKVQKTHILAPARTRAAAPAIVDLRASGAGEPNPARDDSRQQSTPSYGGAGVVPWLQDSMGWVHDPAPRLSEPAFGG